MIVQANAGPSGHNRQQMHKRTAQKGPSLMKHKRLSEKQRIAALEQDAMNFLPTEGLKAFADLPISEATKKGLKKAFFVDMTDIQAKSVPFSLKGKDILGAARTGSGKTLAFLIPVLELLYRRKWGPSDGLGALIISPTRELAVQIFEVLRSIGGYHSFSAGLVIGGKNLKDERDRLSRMNILVATPGRLLQHMDQTVGFESDNLQVLVLDEADRILDMGFSKTLSALLSHLPNSRQTLLFSATQTESVSDLARLSLKDPVHVGVQEATSTSATPKNLEQHYIVSDLDKKLDVLWSFIKSHLQAKILVFMSSCKQVRFVFETFCKMHPGVPLLHLHGKQKQSARLTMYNKFMTISHAVLFATDIAARGLDFPSVDWVLQLDAPEDAETYIHRVGRTARYESKGKGLLFLMPSEEEGMKGALQKKGIEVNKIKIRPSKTHSVELQLQKLAFEDPEIKYLGQRAFVSYLRSVYLHRDKSIFKVDELPVDRFAESLGLPGTPKIKFLNKELLKKQKTSGSAAGETENQKTISKPVDASDSDDDDLVRNGSLSSGDVSEDEVDTKPTDSTAPPKVTKADVVRTKYDRMFERKNQNILTEHYAKLIDHEPEDDDGDDFITLKRSDHDLTDEIPLDEGNLSKRKLKLGNAKRAIAKLGVGQKLVFDDEGKPHEMYELADAEDWYKAKGGLVGVQEEGQKFAEEERVKMRATDVVDKGEAREKKREKKRKRKEKEKAANDGIAGPMVNAISDDDGYVSPEFDLPSDSEESDEDQRPSKRGKMAERQPEEVSTAVTHTIEDDEMLALQLLRKRQP